MHFRNDMAHRPAIFFSLVATLAATNEKESVNWLIREGPPAAGPTQNKSSENGHGLNGPGRAGQSRPSGPQAAT